MVASAVGAVLSGSPLMVAAALNTTDELNSFALVISLLVGLSTLGAGVGRLYRSWKRRIEEDARRDDLLADLSSRLHRIEERQLRIVERLEGNRIGD